MTFSFGLAVAAFFFDGDLLVGRVLGLHFPFHQFLTHNNRFGRPWLVRGTAIRAGIDTAASLQGAAVDWQIFNVGVFSGRRYDGPGFFRDFGPSYRRPLNGSRHCQSKAQ
jgi:hypothetical protein